MATSESGYRLLDHEDSVEDGVGVDHHHGDSLRRKRFVRYFKIAIGVVVIFLAIVLAAYYTIYLSHLHGAQLYHEQYRLQYHFSPPKNWMNDPNGLVFYKGEYHLFYQYNPYGLQWGHMSWGHALSTDLVHWKNLPIALLEEGPMMIFSGSAVVDYNNTSGLGSKEKPALIAIYAGCYDFYYDADLGGQCRRQDQRLAYSLDNGRTWTKYAHNPVLNINESNFRDPKVFWHTESKKWVMVVVRSDIHEVQFYSSPNLTDWTFLSSFGPSGSVREHWECPDLFRLQLTNENQTSKWVLEVDVGPSNNLSNEKTGQYFIGDFNGTHFVCDDPVNRTRWVNHGRDFYAVLSWTLPRNDSRRIWIGWHDNWQYGGKVPTSPWRGSQSLPREVTLQRYHGDVILIQKPVRELQKLRNKKWGYSDIMLSKLKNTVKETVQGQSLEILLNFTIPRTETKLSMFGVKVLQGVNEETVIGYTTHKKQVFLNRTKSGNTNFDKHFASVETAHLELDNGYLTLCIFVDWSSVELFAGDGKVTISDRVFPKSDSNKIELFSEGTDVHIQNLTIYRIKSIW